METLKLLRQERRELVQAAGDIWKKIQDEGARLQSEEKTAFDQTPTTWKRIGDTDVPLLLYPIVANSEEFESLYKDWDKAIERISSLDEVIEGIENGF